MSGYLPIGGGGAGGSSTVSTVSAIAEDMFFTSNNGRDTWTAGNPSRLYSGVACAVGSGNTYDYFMWDVQAGEWRDANLIYQGAKGDKGDKGDSGSVEAVTGVSMDIALGTISTTLTKQSGETISSIPVVLPEADAIESVSNTYSNNQLTTKITTESGAEVESSPVTIESGGGGESLKSASHDVFNGALQTTYTLTDDSTIKSNAIELPTGGSVSIDAPDNTMIKVVDGVLVAAGVKEEDGTIEVSPQSIKIGAHKLSSVGDALGSMNEATEQQRILVFQDISGGITQRPYVYKMKDDDWLNVANIPNTDGEVEKASQSISGFGVGGYYIIKPSSIFFETASPIIDFTFTIFDFDKKIFERTYSTSDATEKLLEHGSIIIDGAADISFAVSDVDGNPIALRGQTELDAQRFAFTIREAERAYLAYEGEGGSGGDYPKNPTFETVTLDMFAGSEASKNINFLSDDLTITNENDDHGVKIEGSHVTLSAGESDVVLDADALSLGFKELINIQSGNKPTSAVNLAQVESMLKNLFLQRVEVTLNDNSLSIDSQYAGKNVFVHGAGLNSELTLNADDFEDYQVVQITRSADYDNPAVPVIITEPNREVRFLVQGTTTFGIYDDKWLVLSDAAVTLAEIEQRAGFKQYTQIRAGSGMTSSINQFGVMTLDVVGGGDAPSFNMPDNTIPMIEDKQPVASAISVENNQLISPYGQQIAGHILESRGEILSVNSHSSVTQPINSLGEYSNPLIFKEVDLEQPLTFINTNFHTDAIVLPNGQEIVVSADDYAWIRTEPDTIHFRAGKIGLGFEFIVVDQHENLIYKIRSGDSYDSNSVVHIHCPSLTLRANKSYHFIVNDLEGNPLTLMGASGVQAWAFDYRHLEQHELLTNQDSVLPEVVQFDQVKTLQLTDHTESVGLTLNSNGVVEVAGQLSLENHHIINISDAEHDHGATSLKQVRNMINGAEFDGSIDIDGQPVEAIQLNEDDFIYSYNEYSKVLNLNIKSNGGGGGGGSADGTVNPIISDNLMTGYIVEFATEDGKFIRSAGIRWEDIQFELERIWDKLDPAYKTAITAQTEAALNTVHVTELNRQTKKQQKDIDRMERKDESLQNEIRDLNIKLLETNSSISTLADRHSELRREVETQNGELESLSTDYVTLQGQQERTTADLTALETEVQVIQGFPLEALASGQFEEQLSIADSFDTLSSASSQYLTPVGAEVEYHLPPDARSSEPAYTVKLTVDGAQHEALKLTTTAIRAGMKPIKELADGVDAQDAVTMNQLAPIHDKIDEILDRLDAIEAHIGMILPPPDVFTVYSGRLTTTNGTTEDATAIKALTHHTGNTASSMLNNTGNNGYTIAAEAGAPTTYSWSVIAYPKGVLDPDPKKVIYNNLPPANRESYEIVIDQVVYVVLKNEYPDNSDLPITYLLAQ